MVFDILITLAILLLAFVVFNLIVRDRLVDFQDEVIAGQAAQIETLEQQLDNTHTSSRIKILEERLKNAPNAD